VVLAFMDQVQMVQIPLYLLQHLLQILLLLAVAVVAVIMALTLMVLMADRAAEQQIHQAVLVLQILAVQVIPDKEILVELQIRD
jgi:hypothetical protein